jgi:hypothetical protein
MAKRAISTESQMVRMDKEDPINIKGEMAKGNQINRMLFTIKTNLTLIGDYVTAKISPRFSTVAEKSAQKPRMESSFV